MEDFAVRFADLVEQVAKKIRRLTVDRVARWIRLGGLGILAASLAFISMLFLVLAIFSALEIPLTTAGAFALVGVVLVTAGTYLWMKRT